MAHRKKRTVGHWLLRILAALILLVLLLAAILAGLLAWRLSRLQNGSDFSFDYSIQSTSTKPPAAYTALEMVGALQGTVQGQSGRQQLQAALYIPGSEQPVTDLYADSELVLVDVGQLYRSIAAGIIQQYPLAGYLLPDWTMGDYISQIQLAELLGYPPVSAGLPEITSLELSLLALEPVSWEGGLDGYLYLTPKQPLESGIKLTIGLPLRSLISEFTKVYLRIEDNQNGLVIELTGKALAVENQLTAPESRISDDRIALLRDIRVAVQELYALVQSSLDQLNVPAAES